MKILFLHKNFPAQYRFIATALASDPKNQVVFATMHDKEVRLPNVQKISYKLVKEVVSKNPPFVPVFEEKVLQGYTVANLLLRLKKEGFVPDVICAHSGWGLPFFVKDVLPNAKFIGYFEWFYHAVGSDFDFPKEKNNSLEGVMNLRLKNIPLLADLEACDAGMTPTHWQHSQLPKAYQPKVSVIHDGIDTEFMKPDINANLTLPNGLTLTSKDEVITYVARGMEEYRGFPEFMKAVEIILKRRPNCHIIIVGEDRVAYGRTLPNNQTFKQKMLAELSLDHSRLHFLGLINYGQLLKVYQISSVHIYLTYPFVLSWSMLEAMSAGCLILGSNTAPVEEVIQDNQNGLLVDFYDHENLANKVDEIFAHPDRMRALRQQARETILQKYALAKMLPRQIQLIKNLCS